MDAVVPRSDWLASRIDQLPLEFETQGTDHAQACPERHALTTQREVDEATRHSCPSGQSLDAPSSFAASFAQPRPEQREERPQAVLIGKRHCRRIEQIEAYLRLI